MAEPLARGVHSLTRGGVALVSAADGMVGGDATGLFVRDRRVVRTIRLEVVGRRIELLSVSRTGPGEDRLLYGVFDRGRDPIALVDRCRSLGEHYREMYTVRTFGDARQLHVRVLVGAGGSTVYHLDEPEPTAGALRWISDRVDPESFEQHSTSGSGELVLDRMVSVVNDDPMTLFWSIDLGVPMPDPVAAATVRSDTPRLARTLKTARLDLEALQVIDPTTNIAFLAAGAPHFLAVFGRDALISNLLSLVTGTERAMNTLEVLAHHQGTVHDATTLEEPGRILHELRIGEMGVFGMDAGTPYFASVDSTPLFVILLEACWRSGAAPDRIQQLVPAARRAIDWCRARTERTGFVSSTPHPGGLQNHGWKDSFDSMVRADASIVEGPTSLAEVQGYVHDAFVALANVEEALGDPDASQGLRTEAAELSDRFAAHFVLDSPIEVALALDADGVPLAVRASNVGHLLDTGIIDDSIARRLGDRLMSEPEFSGWGIRTLAQTESAYTPLGYHTGTVWPHDNAMILRGLIRRGLADHARRLIDGLLDLAEDGGGQLPELVGGFDRNDVASPVPYLASARPQAWAAAVPLQIATSLLGLTVDAPQQELSFQPLMRNDEHLVVEGLVIGDRAVTIEASGGVVTVTGDVENLTITVN